MSRPLLAFLAATALSLGAPSAPVAQSADAAQASLAQSHRTAPVLLVACAPGYPGGTEQAQSTMDAAAAMIARAAGWEASELGAEYHETEQAGLARLRTSDADLALVPLAFFLKHEAELQLQPLVEVVGPSGRAHESWSLVAGTGLVSDPAGLAGWEIVGIPAYAPRFVEAVLLAPWGDLPETATLAFSRHVLRSLRRASAAEPVAVLLDDPQTAALASLPNADALEIVLTSAPLPSAYVATVGERLSPDRRAALQAALLSVHESEQFAEVLETLRLSRFGPVDEAALARVRAAYQSSS